MRCCFFDRGNSAIERREDGLKQYACMGKRTVKWFNPPITTDMNSVLVASECTSETGNILRFEEVEV